MQSIYIRGHPPNCFFVYKIKLKTISFKFLKNNVRMGVRVILYRHPPTIDGYGVEISLSSSSFF